MKSTTIGFTVLVCASALGAAIAACSSGGNGFDGADSGPSNQDSGNPLKNDSGNPADTGVPDDSGTPADGGPCTKPGTLHPPTADAGAKTLYCPFSGVDGGKSQYCNPSTQHCCEPSMGTSTCTVKATVCAMGDTDWGCGDKADCPNQVCCGTGTLVVNPDTSCANYATGFKGTKCAASCTAMEIQMCTSTAECPMGKTCTPFTTKGSQVGGCM